MPRAPRLALACSAIAVALAASPNEARAFCGFYVGGAGAQMFNNATQVVLMRDGLRTVLSMQNNYQGPPTGFAMVVPVPVVLSKDKVKTLPREVFDHVDKLDAPRLVEYWEQDPCHPYAHDGERMVMAAPSSMEMEAGEGKSARDLGVKVEAKFSVGEYDIVILSAKDSSGLDTWLRKERYEIPAGAEPYLRPYVQRGSKFFVAKVDPKRVTFVNGQATLSPLRFHYDSDQFALPIRLGLVNSGGAQDLIVHILAKNQRYEVANYPNVAVPTNLDVSEATREQFGAFYAALFDRVIAKNPKAVVTEYAWQAGSCDPCPTPPLDVDSLATLGADVLPSVSDEEDPSSFAGSFTLTRLHARYTKETLGADLVFKEAGPIMGGREVRSGPNGTLERGAVSAGENNFQARYAIRHPWTGPIECKDPKRGIWGGPPGKPRATDAQPAQNLAFAPRGKVQLAAFIKEDAPELDVVAKPPSQGDPPMGVVVPPPAHTCGCNVTPSRGVASLAAAVVPLALLLARRRARAPRHAIVQPLDRPAPGPSRDGHAPGPSSPLTVQPLDDLATGTRVRRRGADTVRVRGAPHVRALRPHCTVTEPRAGADTAPCPVTSVIE
jgi:hypothetical protein